MEHELVASRRELVQADLWQQVPSSSSPWQPLVKVVILVILMILVILVFLVPPAPPLGESGDKDNAIPVQPMVIFCDIEISHPWQTLVPILGPPLGLATFWGFHSDCTATRQSNAF